MAKIQNLHGRALADGTVSWHWKPSPRLRAKGWVNQALGTGPGAARGRKPVPPAAIVARANELNEKLTAWDMGCNQVDQAAIPAPRKWLFSDLVDAYRQSEAYRVNIGAATRREYDCRLGQLSFWAQDGTLPIRLIDGDMVKELRKALLQGSKFKAASTLRVLRLLLRWAVAEKLLPADPTAGVPIPTPPSRTFKMTWRDTCAVADQPDIDPVARRFLRLAFWTAQRRADMIALNRMAWRELHGADPRDLPALVNGKGQVWGFRLQQLKTQRWVDCPLPPFLHAEVNAAFEQSQWLFPHPLDPNEHISGDVIRRRIKPALVAGGFPDHQLRDGRRSGASGLCDMGADRSDVFAITGHSVLGNQRTMADVYMPPDTRAACRAIAAACRTLAAIEAREKEQAQ